MEDAKGKLDLGQRVLPSVVRAVGLCSFCNDICIYVGTSRYTDMM